MKYKLDADGATLIPEHSVCRGVLKKLNTL